MRGAIFSFFHVKNRNTKNILSRLTGAPEKDEEKERYEYEHCRGRGAEIRKLLMKSSI